MSCSNLQNEGGQSEEGERDADRRLSEEETQRKGQRQRKKNEILKWKESET